MGILQPECNFNEIKEVSKVNIDNLLSFPCKFCGYNGQGYWQKGTHDSDCPWRDVGGETEREKLLPDEVNKRIEFYNEARTCDRMHFEMHRIKP